MGNYASLSEKQVKALLRFLKLKLGDSADALIEELGQEDAFTLMLLRQRFQGKMPNA